MTASTTPRLGLMLPSPSDNFVISDFDQTFTTLDTTPGTKIVANYNALPGNLTSAQHGSCYIQADNGSMWMWKKPGSAAGAWIRINSAGLLGVYNQNNPTVHTAQTSWDSAVNLITANFTARGGRQVMAWFSHGGIANAGNYGMSLTGLFLDDQDSPLEVCRTGGTPNKYFSHHIVQGLTIPAAGSTHKVVIKMMSIDSAGGGLTTSGATGQLYIIEV